MNKYKMISICSLTIACVLLLSILIPSKTIANDKESLNLYMHYENKQVTANIVVNSEIYTGVVCKYLMIDDILKCDNILEQTRNEGVTINLDKAEDDKYTAVIKDVNKRYVVIYVSIGNCSLCDYIDCEPGKAPEEDKQPEPALEEDKQPEPVPEEDKQPEPVPEEDKQPEPAPEEDKQPEPVPEEDKQPEPVPEEDKQPEPAPEEDKQPEPVPEEDKQPEPVPEEDKQPEPAPEEDKQPEPAPAENKKPEIQEVYSQGDSSSNDKSQNESAYKPVDKDSYVANNTKQTIDTSDFQEIEKVASTSTSDDKMPKTGEDDFLQIFGILVFSTISIVSFYKYQTTK